MVSKLQYFVGKACTIFTQPTNRSFDDMQHANCFVGIVESVDPDGIWLKHPNDGRKSFFMLPVVGIVEELYRPMTPEEAEVIRTQMTKKAKTPQPVKLTDIELLKKNYTDFKKLWST